MQVLENPKDINYIKTLRRRAAEIQRLQRVSDEIERLHGDRHLVHPSKMSSSLLKVEFELLWQLCNTQFMTQKLNTRWVEISAEHNKRFASEA